MLGCPLGQPPMCEVGVGLRGGYLRSLAYGLQYVWDKMWNCFLDLIPCGHLPHEEGKANCYTKLLT